MITAIKPLSRNAKLAFRLLWKRTNTLLKCVIMYVKKFFFCLGFIPFRYFLIYMLILVLKIIFDAREITLDKYQNKNFSTFRCLVNFYQRIFCAP